VVKKLQKMCYENFDDLFKRDDNRSKQLALFTLLLNEALQSEDTEHVQQLSPHLVEFIAFVVRQSVQDMVSFVSSQFTFIFFFFFFFFFIAGRELRIRLGRNVTISPYRTALH
jgi:hypothetical protein